MLKKLSKDSERAVGTGSHQRRRYDCRGHLRAGAAVPCQQHLSKGGHRRLAGERAYCGDPQRLGPCWRWHCSGLFGGVVTMKTSANVSQRFAYRLRGDMYRKISHFSFKNIDQFIYCVADYPYDQRCDHLAECGDDVPADFSACAGVGGGGRLL